MESISPACTPLKQRYDSCFNAWFEGYLQPALDASSQGRQMTAQVEPDTIHRDEPASEVVQQRIITNWSHAFRRRDRPTPPSSLDTPAQDQAPTFDRTLPPLPPIETKGKTRAQIKAEEYDRNCGQSWRDYNACLKVAISENQSLSTLLEAARTEHPLSRLDGLEGSAWDANAKLDT